MLSMQQTAALERLKNYGTRYELLAEHPDGRRYLVAYACRKARRDLMLSIRQRGEKIVRALGLSEDATFDLSGSGQSISATMGEWRVYFTGRTQRDCIIEGNESPYVGLFGV